MEEARSLVKQQLEYAPLINQRAHRLGADHRIPNLVDRWRKLFACVSAQLNEIEGRDAAPAKALGEPNREAQQCESGGDAAAFNFQMLRPRELHSVEKLSILVLSDAHGALLRELDPPAE